MKQLPVVLAVSLVLGLSACSSTKLFGNNDGVAPSEVTAVKDQTAKLSTEFKREGVKIYYTWTGDVDRIEAKGFANVWQQQYEHVAELEAKEKLIKFLRGETVSSGRKTAVIAKALERAQDNTLNKFKTVDGTVNTTAEDLENEPKESSQEENSRSNTALRKASINNAQTVTSTITVNASGRLTAVYKKSGEVVNDGKIYVGTYVWTPKDQAAARKIANLMDQR
jgi:DNA polymerase II large subunit